MTDATTVLAAQPEPLLPAATSRWLGVGDAEAVFAMRTFEAEGVGVRLAGGWVVRAGVALWPGLGPGAGLVRVGCAEGQTVPTPAFPIPLVGRTSPWWQDGDAVATALAGVAATPNAEAGPNHPASTANEHAQMSIKRRELAFDTWMCFLEVLG